MGTLRLLAVLPALCQGGRVSVRIKQDVKARPATAAASGEDGPSWDGTDVPCPPGSPLEVTFDLRESTDDKIYGTVSGYSGAGFEVFEPAADDRFEYAMRWLDGDANVNTDLESSAASWRLRDDPDALDEGGRRNHVEHERLGDACMSKFCSRSFPLRNAEGNRTEVLVFAANPGAGRTVRALFQYIRVVGPGGVKQVIWESGRKPFTVSPYFPGTITARCAVPYRIVSSLSCSGPGEHPWRVGALYPSPAVVLGAEFECEARVRLDSPRDADRSRRYGSTEVTLVSVDVGVDAGLGTPLWSETLRVASGDGAAGDGAVSVWGCDGSAALCRTEDLVLTWRSTADLEGGAKCCPALIESLFRSSNLTVSLGLNVTTLHTDGTSPHPLDPVPATVLCPGRKTHDVAESVRRTLMSMHEPDNSSNVFSTLALLVQVGDTVRSIDGADMLEEGWALRELQAGTVVTATADHLTVRAPAGDVSRPIGRVRFAPASCPAALREFSARPDASTFVDGLATELCSVLDQLASPLKAS